MKEQFCTYEIASKLKELGFKEKCLATYFDNGEEDTPSDWRLSLNKPKKSFKNNEEFEILAPLWQQVIDWFRINHSLIIYISSYQKDKHLFGVYTYNDECLTEVSEWLSTYEKAREAAILKAIELCKKN